MKFFSLPLRCTIIFSFALSMSTTSLMGVEAIGEKGFCESFVQGWHALEDKIIEASQGVVDFFHDIFHFSKEDAPKFNYDVTLVGFVNFADGIGRHPILFKECLENHVRINFLSTRDIPPQIEDAQLGLPRLNLTKKDDIGAVAILTDILADKALNIYKKMPDSFIKIAYTMFEATEIPHSWVTILNNKFDMAVVPDPFLINIYRECGVQIPMFSLPLPLMLQDFLKVRPRSKPHKKFVFGMSGGFWKRKNHLRVLEAFAAEFGNRKDVKLKLHGRFGEEEIIKELADKIKEYNLNNVELIVKPYTSDEYLAFFKSLDCYVFLSMGEGFSITPREALACGMPTIVTCNTAQITICSSGAVRVVPSKILVPAWYDCHYNNNCPSNCVFNTLKNFLETNNQSFFNNLTDDELELVWKSANIGYQFDCTTDDARDAMRDVYLHYNDYLVKAKQGREWVKGYLRKNLTGKYVSLVKPQTVILGSENIIGDKFLMTTSKPLYEKYCYLLGH